METLTKYLIILARYLRALIPLAPWWVLSKIHFPDGADIEVALCFLTAVVLTFVLAAWVWTMFELEKKSAAQP